MDPAGAMLHLRGVPIAPVSVVTPAPDGALIDGLRVRVDKNRIHAAHARDGTHAWTAVLSRADGITGQAVGPFSLRRPTAAFGSPSS